MSSSGNMLYITPSNLSSKGMATMYNALGHGLNFSIHRTTHGYGTILPYHLLSEQNYK